MYPFVFAAGLVAVYFGLAAMRRPRPAEILAVVLWSAYAVYEYYVANGTLCDANCNIRVDLLLILPLLGSAAYLALEKAPRSGAVAALYVICLVLAALVASAFGYTVVAVLTGGAALLAAIYGFMSGLSGNRP